MPKKKSRERVQQAGSANGPGTTRQVCSDEAGLRSGQDIKSGRQGEMQYQAKHSHAAAQARTRV